MPLEPKRFIRFLPLPPPQYRSASTAVYSPATGHSPNHVMLLEARPALAGKRKDRKATAMLYVVGKTSLHLASAIDLPASSRLHGAGAVLHGRSARCQDIMKRQYQVASGLK